MFSRVDEFFTITTNNLKALEAVSEWIYKIWKGRYLIQVELFSNITIYHICIPMDKGLDDRVTKKITRFLETRKIQLLEKEDKA